ncbi:MAG TPA: hydroxymethylbilane synthase [Phycisphaerae bacterium]|nr:hydroxymethylbilane synthase [Phycisphaerae bacterium]HOJ74839.1 hydroxymethylbilane synthase [Phycisphaerae bacterium]HOM52002.1 hydroxymethylbilane synthase [Phycisphaerae bacterium]HON65722.1 hydroxymethylbilane synthase [Phycisphaerae bacterium]HOQ86466.1 hydroxymethylbilane synthase [Phycisphaerae bacterium]
MSTTQDKLVVGTRGSLLARTQTQWVIDRLLAAHPGLEVETRVITTQGDRQQDRPLPEIGGKGLFTEELEAALLDGSIDLAVHSTKDLPTELKNGLAILAYPTREDPRDAWISADGTRFEDIPPGSVVGTTSLRRQAQLLMRRPDITFVGLRGNIDTRIRKVQRGDCVGAVLAMSGLKRAALESHVTHPFEPADMLPAPGQGALAVEGRANDSRLAAYLAPLHDHATAAAVNCERRVLSSLDAGCRAPVAVYATVAGELLTCHALVASPDGKRHVKAQSEKPVAQFEEAAMEIVAALEAAGADEIIAECRNPGSASGS